MLPVCTRLYSRIEQTKPNLTLKTNPKWKVITRKRKKERKKRKKKQGKKKKKKKKKKN